MKKPPETRSDGFFMKGLLEGCPLFFWDGYQMITRSSSGMNIAPSVMPKAS